MQRQLKSGAQSFLHGLACRLIWSHYKGLSLDSANHWIMADSSPLFPGHQVYGMMFKPPTIEPGVKYPTVLFLYGGPHVQVINTDK